MRMIQVGNVEILDEWFLPNFKRIYYWSTYNIQEHRPCLLKMS